MPDGFRHIHFVHKERLISRRRNITQVSAGVMQQNRSTGRVAKCQKRCPEDSGKWVAELRTVRDKRRRRQTAADRLAFAVPEIRLCREEWSCSLETNKPLACPILKGGASRPCPRGEAPSTCRRGSRTYSARETGATERAAAVNLTDAFPRSNHFGTWPSPLVAVSVHCRGTSRERRGGLWNAAVQ